VAAAAADARTIRGVPRPESLFLATLYAPLLEDAQRQIQLAMKVAFALEHGLAKQDIAARLDVTLGEVQASVTRLKRVRGRLDCGH
jgi:hypothetical protein